MKTRLFATLKAVLPPLLPAIVLALLALVIRDEAMGLAFMAAAALCAVMALLGSLLLRLTANGGVPTVLLGVVGGMMLRLLALVIFCLSLPLFPQIHLVTACLAAAAGLVAALIIDSAGVARRLCASQSEPVPEVASV